MGLAEEHQGMSKKRTQSRTGLNRRERGIRLQWQRKLLFPKDTCNTGLRKPEALQRAAPWQSLSDKPRLVPCPGVGGHQTHLVCESQGGWSPDTALQWC